MLSVWQLSNSKMMEFTEAERLDGWVDMGTYSVEVRKAYMPNLEDLCPLGAGQKQALIPVLVEGRS